MKTKKIKKSGKPNSMPSALSDGIIWGPHRGSLAVWDHLRSSLGIICGRGLFASLYSTPRSRFSHTDLQLGQLASRLFCGETFLFWPHHCHVLK